ncbi:MAG: transposase [Cyclobacteriaceae bacterium]
MFNWRKKYSGMDASQLKRLKELEDENARLKKMYAELSLDNVMLLERALITAVNAFITES